MDKPELLKRYIECLDYGKVDCTSEHEILSYGKTRRMFADEKNRLMLEINRLEKELELPLTLIIID